MNISLNVVIAVVVIFGFLTGSTLYFYNKNKPATNKESNSQTFNGDIPATKSTGQAETVDKLTKPADDRGRVTFPANVYKVGKGETLFGIGVKFHIDWKLIVLANGLENENSIQYGKPLVIPKLSNETDYYRVEFTINDDNASSLNRELRDKDTSDYYDPKLVAKNYGAPYFGISESDDFSLIEQDNSQATALVQAKSANGTNVVGLYQPKQRGDKGFWAILYIEHHE